MTVREWNAMVNRAAALIRDAAQEQQVLYHGGGMSVAERYAHAVRIRRKYARNILRLALSPEEALGAAQKG